MQAGFTFVKFDLQIIILPIVPVGLGTTGTVTLTLAQFKGCVVVAADCINAAGATDSPNTYFVNNGNVAAGCSLENYINLAGALRGSGSTNAGGLIVNNAIVTWAALISAATLTFDLTKTFVPNRVALFFVQYLPNV